MISTSLKCGSSLIMVSFKYFQSHHNGNDDAPFKTWERWHHFCVKFPGFRSHSVKSKNPHQKLHGSVRSGHLFLMWLHLLDPSLFCSLPCMLQLCKSPCYSWTIQACFHLPSVALVISSAMNDFSTENPYGSLSCWLKIFNQMILSYLGFHLSSCDIASSCFPVYLSASFLFLA